MGGGAQKTSRSSTFCFEGSEGPSEVPTYHLISEIGESPDLKTSVQAFLVTFNIKIVEIINLQAS